MAGGSVGTRFPDSAILAGIQTDRVTTIMANQFLGVDRFDEMLARRSAQVLVAEVRAPGAGWP